MGIFLGVLLALLIGYLLGSISNGVLIGKILFNVDVRAHGSHNAGGTNTGRVLGKKFGYLTIILDISKTIVAMWATLFLYRYLMQDFVVIDASYYAYIAGFASCIGHTFPVFFGFKGGKAVACLGGICLATNWILTLIGFCVFIIVLLISKYVSLSSMTGAITVGILSLIPFVHNYGMIFNQIGDYYYSILMIFLAVYVVIRHRTNIVRLINHNENKISLFKKKNEETK